ncbi:MAG: metallophosphoesterase, partial [Bdellovibrionales bacterium]
MTKLTIAVVTDIHHGPNLGTKKGSEALRLLDLFGAFVRELKPDLSVEMGDRTSDSPDTTPYELMEEVGAALRSKVPGEVVHLIGNHDLDGLTQQDNERALNKPLASMSMDRKGFHLIFWNTNPVLDKARGFNLNPSDLDWLK